MRSSSAFLTLRSVLRSPLGGAALAASLDMVLCAWAKGAAVIPTASASAAAIEQSLSVMIGILVSERESPGPAKHVPGPRPLRSAQQPRDQRDQEQHYEYDEQDLRDFRRAGRDAGKAENCGDDGDDEECERPAKHGLTPRIVGEAEGVRANTMPKRARGKPESGVSKLRCAAGAPS